MEHSFNQWTKQRILPSWSLYSRRGRQIINKTDYIACGKDYGKKKKEQGRDGCAIGSGRLVAQLSRMVSLIWNQIHFFPFTKIQIYNLKSKLVKCEHNPGKVMHGRRSQMFIQPSAVRVGANESVLGRAPLQCTLSGQKGASPFHRKPSYGPWTAATPLHFISSVNSFPWCKASVFVGSAIWAMSLTCLFWITLQAGM